MTKISLLTKVKHVLQYLFLAWYVKCSNGNIRLAMRKKYPACPSPSLALTYRTNPTMTSYWNFIGNMKGKLIIAPTDRACIAQRVRCHLVLSEVDRARFGLDLYHQPAIIGWGVCPAELPISIHLELQSNGLGPDFPPPFHFTKLHVGLKRFLFGPGPNLSLNWATLKKLPCIFSPNFAVASFLERKHGMKAGKPY